MLTNTRQRKVIFKYLAISAKIKIMDWNFFLKVKYFDLSFEKQILIGVVLVMQLFEPCMLYTSKAVSSKYCDKNYGHLCF
jgi:hypothetical protein